MKYVYQNDIGRFVQFAVRVFDVDLAYEDLSAVALEGIKRLEKFYQNIGMPIRLSDADIGDSDFDQLASKATDRGNFGSFASLGKDDVLSILKLAL